MSASTDVATWRMPAETDPQDRIWMSFPPAGSAVTADERATDTARTAWSRVANAIVDLEPVTMIVDPADEAVARRYLSSAIDLAVAPLDDAWLRDSGPTFVLDGAGRLGSVEWVFNGWGQQPEARWDHDQELGRFVTGLAGSTAIPSAMVNEGGGIHVDGLGTVLVTETVQLDPGRNPGLSKADVEAELARTIGATNVVWLSRGLTRDSQTFGTRGHVDLLATVPAPGRLLVHAQHDGQHPDHAITRRLREELEQTTDAAGRPWTIVEVPAPATLRDDVGWVDWSYLNHLVVNDAVICCGFDDPHDEQAREILADAYPGRAIVMIDAREIFARGGGIHCITQHQPTAVR